MLGVRQWRAPPVDLTRMAAEPRSVRAMFGRAVLVSLTNPKTLLFYGALLPQFMSPGRAAGTQVAVLAAIALVVALVVDGGWALLAARVRGVLGRRGRLRNRLSGGLLIGAGVGLAAIRPALNRADWRRVPAALQAARTKGGGHSDIGRPRLPHRRPDRGGQPAGAAGRAWGG